VSDDTERRARVDAGLDALFASEPRAMANPSAIFAAARSLGRAYPHGPSVVLTGYDDVKAVLRADGRSFSNRAFIEGSRAAEALARMSGDERRCYLELSDFESLYMSRSDGDQHRRLRAAAHRAFTPRRMTSLTGAIRRYASDLADELEQESAPDLMSFAYKLPLMVVEDLLGVPKADRALVRQWSAKLARNRNGTDPAAVLVAHRAMVEFRAYTDDLVREARRRPDREGVVEALLDARDGDALSDDELTAMFVLLIFAGHETTTNLIGIGVLELLLAGEWQALIDSPESIPNAVEELLRIVTPVQWLGRVALERCEIAGVSIEAGTTVVPVLAATNRDPDVFASPNTIDVTRANASDHLALAFGPHFCLGAALARIEGSIALETLTTRFPELEVGVERDEIVWAGHALLRTIETLPVALRRAA
jgi:cytochrome P450